MRCPQLLFTDEILHYSTSLASKSATIASQNLTWKFIPPEQPQPKHHSGQTPFQKSPARPTTPKSTLLLDQTL